MNDETVARSSLEHWQKLSKTEKYKDLPPLARLVEFIRGHCSTDQELLDQAFEFCEASVEIGRYEYTQWQGLAILDASAVFSMQGLGGDLCRHYNYDFWDFLRAIGDLAKRSSNPAQYHQCINSNLFSSPADDELIIKRFESLIKVRDLRSFGCMPNTAKLTHGLLRTIVEGDRPAFVGQKRLITARTSPKAYVGYGRSMRLDMDGELIVKSPFCCNTWLERLFFWVAEVKIEHLEAIAGEGESAVHLSSAQLTFQYKAEILQERNFKLRVIMMATADEPADAGRAERYFWIHHQEMPFDASSGHTISMNPSHWKSLCANELEAYGLKCKEASTKIMDLIPMHLVLVLEPEGALTLPMGQMTLPKLWIEPCCETMTTIFGPSGGII